VALPLFCTRHMARTRRRRRQLNSALQAAGPRASASCALSSHSPPRALPGLRIPGSGSSSHQLCWHSPGCGTRGEALLDGKRPMSHSSAPATPVAAQLPRASAEGAKRRAGSAALRPTRSTTCMPLRPVRPAFTVTVQSAWPTGASSAPSVRSQRPGGTSASCASTVTSTDRGVRGVEFADPGGDADGDRSGLTTRAAAWPWLPFLPLRLLPGDFSLATTTSSSAFSARLRSCSGRPAAFSGGVGGRSERGTRGSAGALAEPETRRLRFAMAAAPAMGGPSRLRRPSSWAARDGPASLPPSAASGAG